MRGAGGEAAEVVCVVETPGGDSVALVEVSENLLLTPYHPLRSEHGEWVFPVHLKDARTFSADVLYSFVVRGSPAVQFGGVAVSALGHMMTEGAAGHPYFGTQRVLHDLAKSPGFSAGRVRLQQGWDLRDPDTGLVAGSTAFE